VQAVGDSGNGVDTGGGGGCFVFGSFLGTTIEARGTGVSSGGVATFAPVSGLASWGSSAEGDQCSEGSNEEFHFFQNL